jgi:hypothetical protein
MLLSYTHNTVEENTKDITTDRTARLIEAT